jgi:hypothetical protein
MARSNENDLSSSQFLEVLKFGDLFWDCTLKPIIGNLPVKIEDL